MIGKICERDVKCEKEREEWEVRERDLIFIYGK